jgi:clan AA aspartic protease (TIGR02281 family)
VLDTAAVYTTLAPHLAEVLGISREHALRSTIIRSAVADERGYLVKLDQVTTLGLVFRDVEANVANLGYSIDGLIGMNVLRQMNFEVRPAERRILVERIAS